jgi:two-component system sensor histidine kinase RegB
MPLDLEPDVTVPWLVRLRWLVVAGQAAAMAVAWQLGLTVTWWLFGLAVVLGTVSNVMLAVDWIPARWPHAHVLGGVLVLDVALLTVLLAASGGPSNPFTVLFLVNITLSAVVLSARWTLIVALLSVLGFGLLFLLPGGAADPHAGHHGHSAATGASGRLGHLEGMWVAFVLATALTAFFVRRVSQAIASQREQIASLREAAARNARLAALTTLAAGAAHELGSPLGTISVAAHEARRGAAAMDGAGELAEDLRLIELEVERCQEILHKMAARASQTTDDDSPLTPDELARRIRDHLGDRADRVDLTLTTRGLALHVPSEQMVQSVVALVRNGLDASGPDARVTVELTESATEVRLAIQDRGRGIPGDVLPHIGEPFFTTKQPGRGLGLGVFLARAFFESRGGALTIESTPGFGTRALISLPRDVARPVGAA